MVVASSQWNTIATRSSYQSGPPPNLSNTSSAARQHVSISKPYAHEKKTQVFPWILEYLFGLQYMNMYFQISPQNTWRFFLAEMCEKESIITEQNCSYIIESAFLIHLKVSFQRHDGKLIDFKTHIS